MAKGVPHQFPKCLTFICLVMLVSNLNSTQSHGDQQEQELELLLSFKAWAKDQSQSLSNWLNSSATFCNWHGLTCDQTSSHVNSIQLSGKNMSGTISSSIFHLPKVTNIDLSSNQFAGEISFSFPSSSLSSLLYLNLSNNNLTGSLPEFLFSVSFSGLESLDLSNNMFSGIIPHQLGLLSSLKYFDVGGNVLVGRIPNSITNITGLEYLTLASNQLIGEIPRDIGIMKSLKWIYMGYNNLSGEIPKSIGNLLSLHHLDLVYNNLTGLIPDSLGNLTSLEFLFLYRNNFMGWIPASIFDLKNLVSLDLSDNYLWGEISELVISLQRLEILQLFSNNFTGKIPKALTALPRLQVLQLWSNRLTGEIPKELGMHNNLTVLDLSTNNLSGEIPHGLCDSRNLNKLILFSNSLEGQIPHSLSSCITLRRVRLQNNKLSGQLPLEFTKLPQVYLLDMSGNKISGQIDDRKWDMPALQLLNLAKNNFSGELPDSFGSNELENLDLSENQFSGDIPRGMGSLSELVQLKLSRNRLSGNIPNELSWCKKLVSLDLSHNQLTGQVPISLGDMSVLGILDLSDNQLRGEIPQNLGSAESLVELNISFNRFHGRLPSTGAFLAINSSDVTGNDLCESDEISESRSGLPPCIKREDNNKNPFWWFFLLGLVGFPLAAFLIVVFIRRRQNLEVTTTRVENEDGTWEMRYFDSEASKIITIHDVLSSAIEGVLIITQGRKETVQFEVKEMSDLNCFSEDIGKLRHPNMVKLMGICRCGKGGYLVYEYVDGKYLSDVVGSLSWERRRNIALGIAKALKYLHAYGSSFASLVGEMSPHRVVVDSKDVPRLMLCPLKPSISSTYVAPESRNAKEVTEKSDMYGLGVILIELLTGRSSVDEEVGMQHESIVEWARYCYSDCHLDTWIDPNMKGGISSLAQNDIVEVMNLALQCTATDPTARPSASHVFKTLNALTASPSSCV
ncbi:hypothetical protein K1719_025364 [Acacia pycnantha]|nr:hypothetical protein K1719_025364 [Acacia pycnantha]